MFRLTFNPGPSQVSDEVKADMAYAARHNIIGISHRSQAFISITEEAVTGLRHYFKVPDDYQIVFTSSATEAMELSIRNLVDKESFHFVNGHFSELFAHVSGLFGKTAVTDTVEWGRQNDFTAAGIPKSAELVAVAHNETSTGVICTNAAIRDLKNRLPKQLLAVDITSSAGCVDLNIKDADIWLFSVQKGMGLPSGLGIIFISPKALERSKQLKHAGLFNFAHMVEKMSRHQTIQTPNVLGIYLLAQQLKRWNEDGVDNHKETMAKAALIDNFVRDHRQIEYFVKNPAHRSPTTIALEADPDIIAKMHAVCNAESIVLGAGYGKLKETTCRVATFPAQSRENIKELIKILEKAFKGD